MFHRRIETILGLALLALSGCSLAFPKPYTPATIAEARAKIKHVVMIMQENRSFDHYFGTYPGADGIPMKDGVPTICVNDPSSGQCVKPYHDPSDTNYGGPHTAESAQTDIGGGKMDGFIQSVINGRRGNCADPNDPGCTNGSQGPDVMGWHDAREIPNYWAYAENFVLQDHLFEPTTSWSLPAHLFMVSGWSATCKNPRNPMSCTTDLDAPGKAVPLKSEEEQFAWTDLTYLLHKDRVRWTYYLTEGVEPDCADDAMFCSQNPPLTVAVPSIWNPLPQFTDVHQDSELNHIKRTEDFYNDLDKNRLPAVSWVVPEGAISEHPPASVHAGQAYVTGLVNAVMKSSAWDSTVIFVSWDDWGGFYDHVQPPTVDANGYGLRVPGIMMSPYARKGYIDHEVLSHDAYLKFVEDLFLDSARLDPKTDGRPDSRPTVRENVAQLGDLLSEFDFSQSPLQPLILPTDPPPGPASRP